MKSWTGVVGILLAAVVAAPGFAAATGTAGAANAAHDEKIANIRKLVHIMSGKQMKEMMDRIFDSSFRAIEARMPPEAQQDPEAKQALQEFLKTSLFNEKDLEEMLDLMIPYYDKYLDEGDVADLVRFYESPAGTKFIRVMPEMMAEMMPRIMGWQMEKMKGPMETLRKKLEAIEQKRRKQPPAVGPQGG